MSLGLERQKELLNSCAPELWHVVSFSLKARFSKQGFQSKAFNALKASVGLAQLEELRYYISPPHSFGEVWDDPIHALFYATWKEMPNFIPRHATRG